jgi:hypothetical protein
MGIKCMGEKLEWAPDDFATEQAIMGQPENKNQDASNDRSAVKDEAMIQMFRRIDSRRFFIGSLLPKREFPAG